MKVEVLNAKLNSPTRTLTGEEAQKIDKDLAMLVNSSMPNIWVDKSGHIHQQVEVINLATFLEAIIDRIHKLISGINLKDAQATFLIGKAQEILDKYIPFVLTATAAFPGCGGVKHLQLLLEQLQQLSAKLTSLKEEALSFRAKENALKSAIDILQLPARLKVSIEGTGKEGIEGVKAAFLRSSPDQLTVAYFTPDYMQAITQLVVEAKDEEISRHAVQHLCALQKYGKNHSLRAAQVQMPTQLLIEEAKRSKMIPVGCDAKALILLLKDVLLENRPFSQEIADHVKGIAGWDTYLGPLLQREGMGTETYIERLFFLEEIFPKAKAIGYAFDSIEIEALQGKLPGSCVRQLLDNSKTRESIIQKLYAYLKGSPIKWEELLSISLGLYAQSEDKEISTFIDEVCLKLFQTKDPLGANVMITLVMTRAVMDKNELKLERILNAMLLVANKNKGKAAKHEINAFFKTVLTTVSLVDPKIISRVALRQIKGLGLNKDARSSLCLLQNGLEKTHLKSVKSTIDAALTNKGTMIAEAALDEKFRKLLLELLSRDKGYEAIEDLVNRKLNQNTYKSEEARDYLNALHNGLSMVMDVRTQVLQTSILNVYTKDRFGQTSKSLDELCMSQAIIRDLEAKISFANIAQLYDKNGHLKTQY